MTKSAAKKARVSQGNITMLRNFATIPTTTPGTKNAINCLLDEVARQRKEAKALKALVQHCWVHSGYPDCGFTHMTIEQKLLYCSLIGSKYNPETGKRS